MRWRRDIELALGDASEGALSLLELRYIRGVERPHGLPTAKRQVRVRQQTGNRYLDNLYEEYRACVEVDGTAAHPEDEQWRDKRRDRWNSVHEKIETIRVGFPDLRDQQSRCQTAADVTKWLSARGPAVGHACTRPDCSVQLSGVLPGAKPPEVHPIYARRRTAMPRRRRGPGDRYLAGRFAGFGHIPCREGDRQVGVAAAGLEGEAAGDGLDLGADVRVLVRQRRRVAVRERGEPGTLDDELHRACHVDHRRVGLGARRRPHAGAGTGTGRASSSTAGEPRCR